MPIELSRCLWRRLMSVAVWTISCREQSGHWNIYLLKRTTKRDELTWQMTCPSLMMSVHAFRDISWHLHLTGINFGGLRIIRRATMAGWESQIRHNGLGWCLWWPPWVSNTEPKQATEAPQTFFQDFTLPLVDFSSSGSEEDLPEPSILEARHIRSLPSESSDDDSTDDLEGNSGLDQGIRDGKYREAPTLLVSAAALKDIREFLRGRSKGKGGGHHQQDLSSGRIIKIKIK